MYRTPHLYDREKETNVWKFIEDERETTLNPLRTGLLLLLGHRHGDHRKKIDLLTDPTCPLTFSVMTGVD